MIYEKKKDLRKILASLDFLEKIEDIYKFLQPFYDKTLEISKEDVTYSTFLTIMINIKSLL